MSSAILRGGTLVYEPRSLCWHEHRHDEAAFRRQLFNYGVGFTATLTKAMTHYRRFPRASSARSRSRGAYTAIPSNDRIQQPHCRPS